ncbi:MAG TPA: hypothetical protein VN426_07470 [Syntrophomonadaceae bacterium]|nr:hypothetical protein [Syntrophomonadaceae bacterium]
MQQIILMGSFTLCPLTSTTMISNECLDCEHMVQQQEEYLCTYEDANSGSDVPIKELIIMLLELMGNGQTRIHIEELMNLLAEEE